MSNGIRDPNDALSPRMIAIPRPIPRRFIPKPASADPIPQHSPKPAMRTSTGIGVSEYTSPKCGTVATVSIQGSMKKQIRNMNQSLLSEVRVALLQHVNDEPMQSKLPLPRASVEPLHQGLHQRTSVK